MLIKTITYTDYNDVKRTEDFYFELSPSELLEMEMMEVGGLSTFLQKISNAQDTKRVFENFKIFVLKAYGEKSPDGKRFVKSPELSEAFTQTKAFDQMFMEFFTDTQVAVDFVNAIVPKAPKQK